MRRIVINRSPAVYEYFVHDEGGTNLGQVRPIRAPGGSNVWQNAFAPRSSGPVDPGGLADGEAGLKAWLFQATLRKIVDRRRYWHRAKRDVRREAVRLDSTQAAWLESLTALRAALPSPSAAAGHSEELAKIAAALEQLPEP